MYEATLFSGEITYQGNSIDGSCLLQIGDKKLFKIARATIITTNEHKKNGVKYFCDVLSLIFPKWNSKDWIYKNISIMWTKDKTVTFQKDGKIIILQSDLKNNNINLKVKIKDKISYEDSILQNHQLLK